MVRTRSSARLASASDEDHSESSGFTDNLPPDRVDKRQKTKKPKIQKKTSAVVAPTPIVAPVAPVSVINYATSAMQPHATYIPVHSNPQVTIHPIPSAQQPLSASQHKTIQEWLLSNTVPPHQSMPQSNQHMMNAAGGGYPVHPDVKFRRLPFYQETAEVMKPSTLVPNSSTRIQENCFYFHFTPQQAQTIMNAPEVNVVQVQLRFCMMETSCEQNDCFPPCCAVKVNDKHCPLPMPIPTNKCGVEPKRPPGPVNITSLCKLSPTVANNIIVMWASDFGCRYAVCVSLVRRLTPALLLSRLKNKGTKNPDYTRSLIKEKLREDLDCEIATTSLRVSLVCPLGKMRMICPCRPVTCIHLQCFDASLFLQMNERKPTWVCPVCDKPALYENLVVDGYFLEVLNSSRLAKDCSEIQLHKDGSWSAHTKTEIVPEQTFNEVEVIPDDIDVIPLSDGSDSSTGLPSLKRSACSRDGYPDQPSPRAATSTSSATAGVVGSTTVDLTSDSEDDLPLRRKVPRQEAQTENSNSNASKVTSNAGTTEDVKVKTQRHSSLDLAISSIISLDSPSPLTLPASPSADSCDPPMMIETLDPTMDLDDPAETTEALKQISSNEIPIELETPERMSPESSPAEPHTPDMPPSPEHTKNDENNLDKEDPINVNASPLDDIPDKSSIGTPERLTIETLEKSIDILAASTTEMADPLEIEERSSNNSSSDDMDDSNDFIKDPSDSMLEKSDGFYSPGNCTPIADDTSIGDDNSVIDPNDTPVADDNSIADDTSVVDPSDTGVAEDTSVADDTSVVDPSDTGVAEDMSVADDASVDDPNDTAAAEGGAIIDDTFITDDAIGTFVADTYVHDDPMTDPSDPLRSVEESAEVNPVPPVEPKCIPQAIVAPYQPDLEPQVFDHPEPPVL